MSFDEAGEEQLSIERVEEHITAILDQHSYSLEQRIRKLEEIVAAIERKVTTLIVRIP